MGFWAKGLSINEEKIPYKVAISRNDKQKQQTPKPIVNHLLFIGMIPFFKNDIFRRIPPSSNSIKPLKRVILYNNE